MPQSPKPCSQMSCDSFILLSVSVDPRVQRELVIGMPGELFDLRAVFMQRDRHFFEPPGVLTRISDCA